MYYMKPLKSPTHIHFWRKIFMDSRQFFALWFCDFLHVFMRIMQSENFATDIHTHYRQSETAPHIRTLYARKISPQIYMRIAVRLESVWAIDWALVSLRSFVSCFYICGRRLNKTVFVDWLMPNFGCKSVIKLHKLIVKNVIMYM